jgi:hypothetical protein
MNHQLQLSLPKPLLAVCQHIQSGVELSLLFEFLSFYLFHIVKLLQLFVITFPSYPHYLLGVLLYQMYELIQSTVGVGNYEHWALVSPE